MPAMRIQTISHTCCQSWAAGALWVTVATGSQARSDQTDPRPGDECDPKGQTDATPLWDGNRFLHKFSRDKDNTRGCSRVI